MLGLQYLYMYLKLDHENTEKVVLILQRISKLQQEGMSTNIQQWYSLDY